MKLIQATVTFDKDGGFDVRIEAEGEKSPRQVAFLAYLALDLSGKSPSGDSTVDWDATSRSAAGFRKARGDA